MKSLFNVSHGPTDNRISSTAIAQAERNTVFIRLLLFAIPIFSVVGGFAGQLIGSHSLFYYVSVSVIAFALLSVNDLPRPQVENLFIIFTVTITIWGTISLVWVPHLSSGLSELSLLVFVLVLGVALIKITRGSGPRLDSLLWGWAASYLLAVTFGVWGLLNRSNLPSEFNDLVQDYLGTSYEFYAPTSFFGNPNDFAAFLLTATPLTILALQRSSKGFFALKVVILSVSSTLIIATGSRAGFYGLILMLFVLAYFYLKRRKPQNIYLLILSCALLTVVWVIFRGFPSFSLGESDSYRLELAQFSWEKFSDSLGFGTGAGSIEVLAQNESFTANSLEFSNLHNAFLEILVQYGLLSFLIFVVTSIAILNVVRSSLKGQMSVGTSQLLEAVIGLGLGITIWGFVSSSTLGSPIWLMAMAVLVMLVSELQNRLRELRRDNGFKI